MMWTRSSALIASGAGLLVAAIIGIQLGESAVAEIDPVHFQGPAERPVGIDPAAARAVVDDPYAGAYGWGESAPPGAAGCGGDCEARQARAAAAAAFAGPVETRDAAAPYWRDVTPTTELRPWPPGHVPYRGLSVERYMHYPVNEDQAARAEAAAPDPPATAPAPAEEPVGE
ncbi:MAG: hypothetical protein QOD42_480 [Sphingomonadales bacterium]|jgi:hypothetical protein|nr:hypothetical protein [Sphingomonadales bacterium]